MPRMRQKDNLRHVVLAAALFIATILLVGASICIFRVNSLSVPLPTSFKTATVLSPALHVLSVISGLRTVKRSGSLSRFFAALTILTLAIDTSIVAAGSTRLDASMLDCALASTWRAWYMAKQTQPVRQIQDRFNCCGLRSSHDMAWPFPDSSHNAGACEATYSRQLSCIEPWQGDARNLLGVIMGFASAGIFFKLLFLVLAARLGFILVPAATHTARWPSLEQATAAEEVADDEDGTGRDNAEGRGRRGTQRQQQQQQQQQQDLLVGDVEAEEDGEGRHRGAIVPAARYTD